MRPYSPILLVLSISEHSTRYIKEYEIKSIKAKKVQREERRRNKIVNKLHQRKGR